MTTLPREDVIALFDSYLNDYQCSTIPVLNNILNTHQKISITINTVSPMHRTELAHKTYINIEKKTLIQPSEIERISQQYAKDVTSYQLTATYTNNDMYIIQLTAVNHAYTNDSDIPDIQNFMVDGILYTRREINTPINMYRLETGRSIVPQYDASIAIDVG